jgi:hypothetical protein
MKTDAQRREIPEARFVESGLSQGERRHIHVLV